MGIFNIYIPDIIATKRYMEASSIQTTDVDKIDSSDLENPNMKVSNISIIRNSGGGGVISLFDIIDIKPSKRFITRLSRKIRQFFAVAVCRIKLSFINQDILTWVRSKEFQEKYINTNHPYPPLLNPRTARYSKIPALLAWELNLPLPSGYGFIFLAIHGCGAGAMQVFLEECNIATNSRFDSDRDIYFTHFKNLVFRRDKYIAIWARAYNFESSKLYYLLDSNVPAICVVRDPISLIKPLINHLGNKGFDRIPVINLGDNYEDVILPAEYYYASKNDIYTPSLDRLPDVLSSMKNSQHTLRIRIELLSKNLTNIHYIPFEDIGTSKAFDTLYALSKKYGFDSPKRREVFETKINGSNRSPLFPFTLVCDKNSNIELIVLRVCDNKILDSVYVDMTSILYDGFNPYGIRIIAKKDVYDALQFKLDLLKDISKYIDGYIQALIRIDEIEMKKQFNEEDIIEYLKSNINLAREFKIAFDLEYADVKSRRADIVEKWAYYQEFEKIC